MLKLKSANELFVVIAVDSKGVEGLAAYLDPKTQTWMPMVGLGRERLEALFNKIGQRLSDAQGATLTLVRLSNPEVLATLSPRKKLTSFFKVKDA